MNPNSPNQQQPAPGNGVPPYAAQPQQGAAYPPAGAYPQNLPPVGPAPQPTPSPMPVPPPPAAGQVPGAIPAPNYQPAPAGQPTVTGIPGQQMPNGTPSQVVQGAAQQQNPGVKATAAPSNPNSTQNLLQIAEIRDGIVIMNDGSFRSVVMVKSINFDLMSQQEQEAVEYNYQAFLNSLYFPVQIFIRSQKVDLAPYIERLDKIRSEHDNMLLALLMDDYIGYITVLSQQTNIMDKMFYIVIPFFPHIDVQKALSQSKNFISGLTALFSSNDQHVVINEDDLEKAKTELRNRVQAVLSGLLQCNIQGLPLDTQELIELFYDSYNPDTATRQQLKNFSELSADVVAKGQGKAPQPFLDRELM